MVVEKDVSKNGARSSVQTLVGEFFKIMLKQVLFKDATSTESQSISVSIRQHKRSLQSLKVFLPLQHKQWHTQELGLF